MDKQEMIRGLNRILDDPLATDEEKSRARAHLLTLGQSDVTESANATSKPRSFLGLIIIIVVAAFAKVIGSNLGHELTGNSGNLSDQELGQALEKGAAEIRSKAPIKVDDVTMLTGAEVSGKTIIYRFAIGQNVPDERTEEFTDALEQQATKTICSNEKSSRLVRLGVRYRYEYKFPSGRELSVRISSC